jgi:hypothetical protein
VVWSFDRYCFEVSGTSNYERYIRDMELNVGSYLSKLSLGSL